MQLAGGQIKQLSATSYEIIWNTGEVLTVVDNGTSLDAGVGLASGDGPGTMAGLLGTNNGAGNNFTLPNGTVLAQPLTSTELYQTFANAWRVSAANTLLDGPAPTNAEFPQAFTTLAQLEAELPAALIQQAQQAIAAAGITDPGVQQIAEFDFLASGGDPNAVAEDANQLANISPSLMTPTTSGPPPALLGVIDPQPASPRQPPDRHR